MTTEDIWIWGRHPVVEGIRAGTVREVLFAATREGGSGQREVEDLARSHGVRSRHVQAGELDRIAPGQKTQGFAARMQKEIIDDVRDLLPAHAEQSGFLLALDQIQDPHNLGALLRTADAAGVQGAVLPDRRSAPLSGTVAKASAGALSHLPVARVANLNQALRALSQAGLWVIGLDGSGERTIYEVDLRLPLVLVVGSEGTGMRRLTRERCDVVARLPMHGRVESLNASVAGAIALYEVVRQRNGAGKEP